MNLLLLAIRWTRAETTLRCRNMLWLCRKLHMLYNGNSPAAHEPYLCNKLSLLGASLTTFVASCAAARPDMVGGLGQKRWRDGVSRHSKKDWTSCNALVKIELCEDRVEYIGDDVADARKL